MTHPRTLPPKCLHLAVRAVPKAPLPRRWQVALEMLAAAAITGHFPQRRRPRGTMAPWLSGDGLRAQCQHVLDERHRRRPGPVRPGDAVFVQAPFLELFRREFLPGIRAPFVLVSADSDLEAPGRHEALLDDPRLLGWFAINVTRAHPRLHPVPIGVYDDRRQHAVLSAALARPPRPRDIRVLGAFDPATHPERDAVRTRLAAFPGVTSVRRAPCGEYFRLLRRSRFVLSPRGAGLDCYRTWEALLCGAIPIVRTSPLDRLYAGLPVLVVHDWAEVTDGRLKEAEAALGAVPVDESPLLLATWAARIAAVQASGREDRASAAPTPRWSAVS
ncbi:MAG TPA: hypothetical protein VHE13_18105 [Opitutus sp.]|nr:hypothetical protein [Opitutus sp.]